MAWRRILPIAAVLVSKVMVILSTIELPRSLLPDNIIPLEYKLTFVPYMRDSTPFYDCSVIIFLLCKRRTNFFSFHTGSRLNLSADRFAVYDSQMYGTRLPVSMRYNATLEQFQVKFPFFVEPGRRLVLAVETFRGPYSEFPKGFYRHPEKGSIRMVLTQFQENHARSVFPCFDEPRFKAVFFLVMYRQRDLGVLTRANAPLQSTHRIFSGWFVDIYEPSVAIPTYLVAFAAFKSKYYEVVNEDILVNGTRIKVGLIYNAKETRISRRGNGTCWRCTCTTDYVFKHISNSMNYMTKYMGVPYAMKKYDVILSSAAAYSGMENMGMVVFKAVAGCNEKVHAHEVIHQWIGNVVSPYWWGDLWLSEGFTTYYSNVIIQTMYRKLWAQYSQYRIKRISKTMMGDTDGYLPPVSHSYVEKLTRKLGAIYAKASVVIQMLTSIIGEETLQSVVKKYYQIHQFSNVTHADLIDVLSKFFTDPSIDIGNWIETWIHNAGFPVVIFSRRDERITARQVDIRMRNITWPIPLTWTTNCEDIANKNYNFSKCQFFMNETVVELPVKVSANECFIANPYFQGYYLPIYDEETWKLIQNMWDSTMDRINLTNLRDSFDHVAPFRIYEPYIFITKKVVDLDNSTRTVMDNFLEAIPEKVNELQQNYYRWYHRFRYYTTTETPSVSSTLSPR